MLGMGMVWVTLFVFFALSRPVLLYTPGKEQTIDKNRCVPFSCGKLGEIKFPYTNKTRPKGCGPFMVDGCDKKVQRIQFVENGEWYKIEDISQGDIISITDEEFNNHLKANSCEPFNNLSLPNLPYVSLQITSNLTVFKCPRYVDVGSQFELKYECDDFRIYYNSKNTRLPPSSPPISCSTVHLPANQSNSYHDIFRLLTAKFSLKFIWDPCAWCLFIGSECPKINGNVHCDNVLPRAHGPPLVPPLVPPHNPKPPSDRGSKSLRLKLGLGLGGPALMIILLAILFVWHQYKRKKASQSLLSANRSDLSKSDLEGGSAYLGVLLFSYKELEAATNNFSSQRELGDGGFGTVYYGKLHDGREVAVKRLYENNYRRVEQFINEIEILTHLHHRNLVTLYGCTSRHSRELLLVYEYIPNGTVADHLHGDRAKSDPLTWPTRMRIAIETAKALTYLHASEIIHRDVKTNNILLDNNFCVKVADFGLSRLFPNDVTHISTAPQGTPGYVDPVYHQCYQLTAKSDVYSFGVVLVELISSMPAVDITRHRHEINLANLAINRIQKDAFDELIDTRLGYDSDEEVKRMTTSVAELAFLCLQQDKEMRPCMKEVLEELQAIGSGGYDLETLEEEKVDNDVLKNAKPPDSDEMVLLKNLQSSPSSNSKTDKWIDNSSTATTNVSN